MAAGEPSRVPPDVRTALQDPDAELLVSAASAMEIAVKTRLGRIPDLGLLQSWQLRMNELGATGLSITTGHVLRAGALEWSYRDPFDGLLVAQFQLERATLVTVDARVRELEALDLLAW